ncbi:hypothetical protein PA01_00135 [Azoarcus sp. PA01]|nr:hypothetical protein PA01_19375 [Azoarcus sp. PA01]KON82504.1 hypothetical protein PA01_00135 [Azoarcus sp. PA01]
MERLDMVLQNQQIIIDQLTEIRKELREMQRMQIQTLEVLVEFVKQFQSAHLQNLRELHEIQLLVTVAVNWSSEQSMRPIENLAEFLELRRNYGFANNRFNDFAHFRAHFNELNEYYHLGMQNSVNVLMDYSLNQVFKAYNYAHQNQSPYLDLLRPDFLETDGPKDEKVDLTKDAGMYFWTIMLKDQCARRWKQAHPESVPAKVHIGLLQAMHPCALVRDTNIRATTYSYNEATISSADAAELQWVYRNLENVVEWNAAKKIAEPIIDSHFYSQLVVDRKIPPLDEILNQRNGEVPGRIGRVALGYCRRLLNLCITQESIFAGEGIVPLLLHDFVNSSRRGPYHITFHLLQFNALLASNWSRYAVRQCLAAAAINPRIYEIAVRDWKNPSILRRFLSKALILDYSSAQGAQPNFVEKAMPWRIDWAYEGEYVVRAPGFAETRKKLKDITPNELRYTVLPDNVLQTIHDHWQIVIDIDGDVNSLGRSLTLPLPSAAEAVDDLGYYRPSSNLQEMIALRDRIDLELADYDLCDALARESSRKRVEYSKTMGECVIFNSAFSPA